MSALTHLVRAYPRRFLPSNILTGHLTATATVAGAGTVAGIVTAPFRGFQTTTVRPASKETRDREGAEQDVEHHKQDQLKKQEQGRGHWKEELASDSESAVKADRDHNNKPSAKEEIKKLQDQTVKASHSDESSF